MKTAAVLPYVGKARASCLKELLKNGPCRLRDPGSTRPGSETGRKRRQDNARQFGEELDSSSGIALWRDGRHTVVELLYLFDCFRISEGVARVECGGGDSDGGLGLESNSSGHKPTILQAQCECDPAE